MAKWTFTLGTPDNEQYEFTPLSPSLALKLKDYCELTFELNLMDAAGPYITELETDIRAYRDGTKIFQGRVVPSQDRIDVSRTGYTSFTVQDYRGLLGRCFIYDDDAAYWFDEDVAVILQEAINWRQSRTGGGLGITFGTGFPALGVVRNEVEWPPGQAIAEGMNTLQESKVRGFDWEIDANRVANMWAARGTTFLKRLEHHGTFLNLTRQYKAEEFANAVRASGGDQPVPEVVEASGLASDPRGRWEKEVSWPDTETQEVMQDRTEYLLEQEYKVPEEYDCELLPGFWQGPSHVGLGDKVTVAINRGRLVVDKELRVHEIQIDLPTEQSPKENVRLMIK